LSLLLFCWSFAVLFFWVALCLDPRRLWPRHLKLPEASAEAEGVETISGLAVVVPARNEAELLGETLPSLLEQSADYDRLVLVDDRSEDGTGQLARKLLEDSPASESAQVLKGAEPPPGWSGKIYAASRAVEKLVEAPGGDSIDWFLFTDADIRHPPGSIRALRQVASSEAKDLVSVMVRLNTGGWWERLLIPAFVWFFQLLFPFRSVSKDTSSVAAAAGGCILVSREYLEKIGGLESICGEIIDDVNLAKRVKAAGGSLWLGLSTTMVSLRSATRLRELSAMVTRTAFDQLGYRYWLLLLTLAGLLAFFISPPLLCAVAMVRDEPLMGLAAALAMSLQTVKYWPAVSHHGLPPRYALSLPLASCLYLWMTFLSGWNHLRGRGESWRGRTIGTSEP
jgi:hopene-associated glycosyltransferase HpnB